MTYTVPSITSSSFSIRQYTNHSHAIKNCHIPFYNLYSSSELQGKEKLAKTTVHNSHCLSLEQVNMQSCILAQNNKFSSQLVVEISAKLSIVQCSNMGSIILIL